MGNCEDLSAQQILGHVFSVVNIMSTEHFAHLHREFGYTGAYNSDLKFASRHFSERALPSIGLSTPSVTVAHNVYDEEGLLSAWKVFLTELRRLNLEADICEWIEKLRIDRKLFEPVIGSQWKIILVDWAIDKPDIPPLKISPHNIKDLKLIVLKNEFVDVVSKFHENRELNEWMKQDEWENYIVNHRSGEAWMVNFKRLYRTIDFWRQICNLLSSEEIEILDKWGYSIIADRFQDYVNNYYVSISQLSEDLRGRGYL